MKKSIKILIAALLIAVVAVVAVLIIKKDSNTENNNETEKKSEQQATNLEPVEKSEDLETLVNKLYEGQENVLPSIFTQSVDMTDEDMVKYVTALEDIKDIEYVTVSEPMMTSQAYSLVLVKVKEGVDADKIAKEMNKNADPRKWICVTAEKVYTTSSGDVVCFIMSSEELAKPIYEKFKALAGTIGNEYERTEQEPELPEDMY